MNFSCGWAGNAGVFMYNTGGPKVSPQGAWSYAKVS